MHRLVLDYQNGELTLDASFSCMTESHFRLLLISYEENISMLSFFSCRNSGNPCVFWISLCLGNGNSGAAQTSLVSLLMH